MCDGCWSLRPGATGGKRGVRTHKGLEIVRAVSDSALSAAAATSVQAQEPATRATLRDVLGSSRRLRFLGCRARCEDARETRRGPKGVRSVELGSIRAEQKRYKLCMYALCPLDGGWCAAAGEEDGTSSS